MGEHQIGSERFPVITDSRLLTAKQIAECVIGISDLVDNFSAVQRVPRYSDGRRENDVEHSFMLAVVAPEIAQILGYELDLDRIRRYSLVHDLLECKVGDVATFDLNSRQLAEKKRLEEENLEELLRELGKYTISGDLANYEAQSDREARFVRFIDKLLPLAVDITGKGTRVVREDYGVPDIGTLMDSHDSLHASVAEKCGDEFPEVLAAHAVLCKIFEEQFKKEIDQYAQTEIPRNPTEIELKYLIDLDSLPPDIDLNKVRKVHIRQGYVAIGTDGSETRVRSFDDERFELTTKSPGTIARDEQTVKLSREMFNALWHQTAGRLVIKTRYYIQFGKYKIELDVYEGHLEGLVTAEVEFDGRPTEAMIKANTFDPPEWFGRNVSEDSRYKNHNLAQRMPQDPIPMGS